MDTISISNNYDSPSRQKIVKLFTDPVTAEDVATAVKRALGPAAKIVNYHVRIFSEEKIGFLGSHRKLVVTVQTDTNPRKEIHSFFIKSMPYDVEVQADFIGECRAFYKETMFYKELLPELLCGLDDKSWIAQNYLEKDDALIFEDLKLRDFAIKGKLLDIESTKSALTCLAKFHASSLLAERRLGKSLIEIYPDMLQESMFVRTGKFYQWISSGIELAVVISKTLGLDSTYIPDVMNRVFEMVLPSKTKWNVVCHGDVKSYNLMFDNSNPSKCILIDYQLLRYAPPTIDLNQMLYLLMRRELRENSEKELLKHYHKVLYETVKSHNKDVEVLSLSELLQEYEETRLVGLVTNVLYSPTNLMDGKICEEIAKDSDGFSKLLTTERIDIVLDMMKKDSYFNELLVEIFTELSERSKQWMSS